MKQLTMLDTSVASLNVGDEIIMDAVRAQVHRLFPDFVYRTVPTHERLGARTRKILDESEINLAGGTNLVGSPMLRPRLWKIGLVETVRSPRVTLMGCGWRSYRHPTSPYARLLLRRALTPRLPHAVRDQHTADMLATAGIENTLVTGCPTTWQLTPEHTDRIPRSTGETVVIAMNGQKDPPGFLQHLLAIARSIYREIYFWPQTPHDFAYLSQLSSDVRVVEPNLASFDRLLTESESIDYVGSRLHGGIRALQHGRRSLIFEVDNRAAEMGRTLRLPTLSIHQAEDDLEKALGRELDLAIELPVRAITEWKQAVATVNVTQR